MQSVTLGTSRERVIRTTLMTILVGVFAAAFLRDGFTGYARKNADELAASLGLGNGAALVINEKLTKADGLRMASEFTDAGGLAGVRNVLGEPAVERDGAAYYVGAGGYLLIETKPGRPAEARWVDGGRTETDQALQRWVGYVLAIVTLAFVMQLLRVLATRTTLSQAGLKLPGRSIIPLDAIRTVRMVGERGAAVELTFADGERTQAVVLDPYVIGRLDALVAAVCEACGIPNPSKTNDTSGA